MGARGHTQSTVRFEGRLDVTPPIADGQLVLVPARRGVVALLAEGDRPIVLLTAADMRSRVRNRLRNPDEQERRKVPDLHVLTRAIVWTEAPGHFEADWTYLEIARRLWPNTYSSMLASKPPWFVRADPQEKFPHFARTREPLAAGGLCLGPFESARSTDAFIETLQDAFDLCRQVQCLRRSPHAQPCAYAQIGKCLSPCDGSIPLEAYRKVVAEAAEFALGRREAFRAALAGRMKRAAGELKFERAAALKARLARLDDLDKPEYAYVAPLEEFRFLLLSAGENFHRVKVFAACLGAVRACGTLEYPPRPRPLAGVLKKASALQAETSPDDGAGPWRMALVCRMLQAGRAAQGAAARWTDDWSPQRLGGWIEQSAAILGLRAPKPRGRSAAGKAKTEPPSPSP